MQTQIHKEDEVYKKMVMTDTEEMSLNLQIGLISVPTKFSEPTNGTVRIICSMPPKEEKHRRIRVTITEQQRQSLIAEIRKLLAMENKSCIVLYEEILQREKNEGIQILPLDDRGYVISEVTFKDIATRVKQHIYGRCDERETKQKKIIRLFKLGYRKDEIVKSCKLNNDYVTRTLSDAGLIEKKFLKKVK